MSGVDWMRLGRLHELLLSERRVRSAPAQGRVTDSEREAVELLGGLSDEEAEALDGLLEGQGWVLVQYDDTMPGIPSRGRAWFLLRSPSARGQGLLTIEPAWRAVRLSWNEPRATTSYWFLLLWYLAMSLFYERCNRALSEVSEYVSASFAREDLEQRLRELLEELGNEGSAVEGGRLRIVDVLLAADGGKGGKSSNLNRRIDGFLTSMSSAGMIERIAGPAGSASVIYRQTLLCAAQVELLDSACVAPLLPGKSVIAGMDAFLAVDAPADEAAEAVVEPRESKPRRVPREPEAFLPDLFDGER
jgi:hypothetical protein